MRRASSVAVEEAEVVHGFFRRSVYTTVRRCTLGEALDECGGSHSTANEPEGLMNETRTLARFVAQTKFGDLPRRLVDNLKITVLDTLGAALRRHPSSRGPGGSWRWSRRSAARRRRP